MDLDKPSDHPDWDKFTRKQKNKLREKLRRQRRKTDTSDTSEANVELNTQPTISQQNKQLKKKDKRKRYKENKKQKQKNDAKDQSKQSEQTEQTDQLNVVDEKEILNTASEMWEKVKTIAKASRKFLESKLGKEMHNTLSYKNDILSFLKWEDNKKLKYFQNDGYKDFMVQFAIASRYMICMGKYSRRALQRVLMKIRTLKHPPMDKREKGYTQDQWLRRQADYVRYLWEFKQGKHIDHSRAKFIWEDAYKSLKGETDDFRDKYKDTEKLVKEEKLKLHASSVTDLLRRLKSGEQKLSPEREAELVQELRKIRKRRRYQNVMDELEEKIPKTPVTSRGIGCGAGTPDGHVPTIRMIEHIDPAKMDKVPEHLRIDDDELRNLRKNVV